MTAAAESTTSTSCSVSAQWARWLALKEDLEARDHHVPGTEDDQQIEQEWKDAFQIEKLVLSGPIQTMCDAIAKLSAIDRSFENSERTDGADQEALNQVTRWLEAKARAPRPLLDEQARAWITERVCDLECKHDRLADQIRATRGDDDEVARLSDKQNEIDAAIRSAPCVTRAVARAQLDSLRRDAVWADMSAAGNVPAVDVFDQLLHFVSLVPEPEEGREHA